MGQQPIAPRKQPWRPASAEPQKSRFDTILQRCAWIAQIFLLIAAVVGYVLTVRPVYQKQLLDEQIAERNVQLREATVTLEKLRAEEVRLKAENAKLTEEGGGTYRHLRQNLISEFTMISTSCVYGRNSPITGDGLWQCVESSAQKKIIAYLKKPDQEQTRAVLQAHRGEISRLPASVTKARGSKLKQARQDVARLKQQIERLEPDLVEELRRLRRDKGEAAEFRSISEVVLRGSEERQAYAAYIKAFNDTQKELSQARVDEINASSDLEVQQSEALDKIMERVVGKLRK